ncbi:alpha-D-ribose 1-methylphosphonate 5-triphosphate diphosphatase [Mycobacterium sp. 3519A]|uniref:alpha-D-ribose 1-methylphosphonate 5-triphosphate diphosphatase n=1 Tax=Mycobacterium sp. 3519A TaxID=2057184 RepID=UPI000C7BA3E6|nr:alpha-D-ribose 1-methylphosphonate 5-triphosphate diphosphatase [Mycobacterium sp. 3519A]
MTTELSESRLGHWPLAAPPDDYVLGHVRAVLPDRVLDDALVAVRGGLIAAVEPHRPGVQADVDGEGLLCIPGLVDTHSDGLEKERLPRPGAELPLDFALLSFEAKLRAAAVTTVFHGTGFENSFGRGVPRTVEGAQQVCAAIDARAADGLVDHRLLYRLDVRSADGLRALQERLADITSQQVLVSHEDHTPGIGQYADRRYYERYIVGTRGFSQEEAVEHVDELIAERDSRLGLRDATMSWLSEQAGAGRIRLLGHDLTSAAEVEELVGRGGAVAEFPTTVEAAEAARERGLPVVMGAPNVLRGSSHNGNASARELVGRGLVTSIASDYLPSGLLAAVFALEGDGLLALPAAIGLVTAGPADVAGITDRGRLQPGLRADIALIATGPLWPVVHSVLVSAR